MRSGAIDVLVIDSVAALVPRAELEGEMGDSQPGLQARLMSQALRKLTASINKSNTMVIFINQIRMKIGVMYGSPETTTGGNALKFYASVRLDIRRIGAIKDRDEVVGNQTRVKVVKNKLAPPFKQVEFDIMYGEGISKNGELIDLGVKAGVVEKSGAWFSYDSQRIGQGRENAKVFLKENPDIAAKIEVAIRQNSGLIAEKILAGEEGEKTTRRRREWPALRCAPHADAGKAGARPGSVCEACGPSAEAGGAYRAWCLARPLDHRRHRGLVGGRHDVHAGDAGDGGKLLDQFDADALAFALRARPPCPCARHVVRDDGAEQIAPCIQRADFAERSGAIADQQRKPFAMPSSRRAARRSGAPRRHPCRTGSARIARRPATLRGSPSAASRAADRSARRRRRGRTARCRRSCVPDGNSPLSRMPRAVISESER